MASVQETDEFECLKADWGTAYRFEYWPGTSKPYRAYRRDEETELADAVPGDLRDKIRADYLRRPVQNDVNP